MNYRDDMTDIMVASDGTRSGLSMTLNDRLTAKDKLANQNAERLNDHIRLSENIADRTITTLTERLGATDAIFDKKISRHLVVESVTIADTAHRVYRDEFSDTLQANDNLKHTLTATAVVQDSVGVSDANQHILKEYLSDGAKIASSTSTNRKLGDNLSDTISTADTLMFGMRDRLDESLTVTDRHTATQQAKNTLSERLVIIDGIVESFTKTSLLDEQLSIGDEIFDKLIAKDHLQEWAMVAVLDEVIQDSPSMAWTMNTVNQAMSQYAPYDVERVAVVGGVLYGESKDGVYQLDGVDETITGVLMTDKVDYGENLIKPSYAYTEYRTDGNIKLTVHTTQKGVAQKYTYALPRERAGELTNGRFVFGRGLYGRQFAYTLTITAKHALLHDLNIHFETTNRRL